ncbi:hypothetical protein CDD82_6245 [Ophiocordyceps australis]|uniref:Xylanolytic transcriptional activator regulatory domain-containing protein n=1 Tax=Ophiocordyceps australis TaxID=1399860 RepID=A0A2C5Y1G5_9HYPO|nr:hypothetical protein CDD82_6245 [Ophiocordyceps australis]
MGIPTYESPPPSGAQSSSEEPEPVPRPSGLFTNEAEFWLHCTPAEVARLISVFEEEVESVYPFIDVVELSSRAEQILHVMRNRRPLDMAEGLELPVTLRDIEMTKIAVATGLVIEGHGKTELSTAMAESVERQVSRISSPEVELKEIQLLTMLSIYYFHCDEDLLAWRTIGIAAREALEMGLHRRKSLFDNFKDTGSRRLATRVFWCVYVLDRRWSFGTSLSFALADRDIDPNLPEPARYARLCSKLWEAIPPFGSQSQAIPEDAVQALDLRTQDWLESIPSHLRLRHPRLGLAARSQPRLLQRLRALLYLRGNHTRISIYQHFLLSASSIMANLQRAWLVVNIAQDSVEVLVHLNATTDIYSRQQNAFNYFLLSALAVIFLSVCHAPNIFTEPCRKCFLDAVELVRGFSRHSAVSRRLWKSIRGLLPRLKSLGIQSTSADGSQGGELGVVQQQTSPVAGSTVACGPNNMPTAETMGSGSDFRELSHPVRADSGAVALWDTRTSSDMIADTDLNGSVPDMFQIRNDLLDLFDALGQGQSFPGEFGTNFYSPGETDAFNRRLQGLI